MAGNTISEDPSDLFSIFGGATGTLFPPLTSFFGFPGLGFPGPAVTECALIDLSEATGRQANNAVADAFWNFFGALFGQPAGRIIFQYMPEGFTESKSAEYANVNIIGRSEPVLGYSHSGPRVFNITLTLVCGLTADVVFDVIRPLWLVRSWLYPDYSDAGYPAVPPKLLFVVGSWIRQMVVVTRLDIQYQAPWSRVHFGALFKGSNAAGGNIIKFPAVNIDAPSFVLGSQLTMPEGGSPLTDALVPHRVDINMTLQEVSPSALGKSPPGTVEVRQGADRPGKGGSSGGGQSITQALGSALKSYIPGIIPMPF